MTPTIRHPPTADAIVAYLASADDAVTAKRLVRYVALMHYRGMATVRRALRRLLAQGRIVRVGRGWYATIIIEVEH